MASLTLPFPPPRAVCALSALPSPQGKGAEDQVGQPAVATDELTVPNAAVGHLIGKAGARINLIRSASGCKVVVDQGGDQGGGGGSGAEGGGAAVAAAPGHAMIRLEGHPRCVAAATVSESRRMRACTHARQVATATVEHNHLFARLMLVQFGAPAFVSTAQLPLPLSHQL